ncbi:MAG: SpoIIE family protein phosphatase [Anaerolineae bacterium]
MLGYVSYLAVLILTQPLDNYNPSVLGPVRVRPGSPPDGPLRPGDQLVAVDGRSVEAWINASFPIGDLNFNAETTPSMRTYTVQRGPITLDVPVTLERVPLWRIVLRSWNILLPAAAFAGVAALMFFSRRADFIAVLTALCFLAETANLLNNAVPPLGLNASIGLFWLWSFIDVVSFWFFFSLVVHVFFIFPERSAWLDRFPRLPWLIHLFSPLVGLSTLLLTPGSPLDKLANVQRAYYVVGIAYLLIGIGRLIRTYRRATSGAEMRGQIRWIIWGGTVSAVPWLIFTALPSTFGQPPLLPLEWSISAVVLVPIAFTFAITRYRLFDIDVVIHRSLVYTLLSALLISTYLGLVGLLSFAFRVLTGDANRDKATIIFFSTMGAAALFNPARQRIQRLVNRLFYQDRLSIRQFTHRLNQKLGAIVAYEDLARFLIYEVPEQLSISGAYLFMLDGETNRFVAYNSEGDDSWSLPANGPLVERLLATDGAFALRKVDPVTEPLRARNIEIALPLVAGERLVGIYAFGPKKSKDFYNSDDVAVFRDLGYRVTVAVENSRLHRALAEQTRWQQEIELARATQKAMLPKQAPEFFGWDLSGFSIPAQEVGGDFFSFHPLGFERLAVAVGDVTGKGMAAALLMSGSVIALAGAVATAPRPSPLLSLVNRVILPYTGKNQNTALCYAVLQQDGHLLVANAGGIEPLLRRADGRLEWIEVGGLPLGTVANDDPYAEVSRQLAPGDTVVFISDGLVEARNRAGDMFGFERLEVALRSASAKRGAQSVANHLVREMRRFTGPVPHHDDVTLVVAQMIQGAAEV